MGSNSSSEPSPNMSPDDRPTIRKLKDVFQLSTGSLKEHTGDCNTDAVLSFDVFQTMFSIKECDEFGRLLLAHIKPSLRSLKGFTLDEFVEIGDELIRESGPSIISIYWDILTSRQEEICKKDFLSMVHVTFTFACVTSGCGKLAADTEQILKDRYLGSICDGISKSSDIVHKTDFIRWVQKHCPHIFTGIHSWVTGVWTDLEWKRNIGKVMTYQEEVDVLTWKSTSLNLPVIWMLSICLPHIYRLSVSQTEDISVQTTNNGMRELFHWIPLYNSNDHGTSMNRFMHHVLEYSGPTILLVEFEENNLFCIAIDEPWNESSQRWGSTYTMFVQLRPEFKTILSGSDMVFMNTQLRGLPKGIQIGKDSKTIVLHIDEELTSVQQYGSSYKIIKLEVWGCGSNDARKAQLEQRQWELRESDKLKNRKLKADDWKDSPDRELLSLGGIDARHSENLPPDEG